MQRAFTTRCAPPGLCLFRSSAEGDEPRVTRPGPSRPKAGRLTYLRASPHCSPEGLGLPDASKEASPGLSETFNNEN